MKTFFKDYFHYTRSERNGFVILLLTGIVLLFIPGLYENLFHNTLYTDFANYESEIDRFLVLMEKSDSSEMPDIEPFLFNPNTASVEDFQNLGLSKKVAQRILNYRNKGGKFYKKEDFKKIYGLKEKDYLKLKAYIILENSRPDQNETGREPVAERKEPEHFEFDPNTVSKQEILRLGLSERVARTMLNFRKQGGTFKKREDLSKIYGISEEDFERLFPYIVIRNRQKEPLASKVSGYNDQAASLKIEINTATIDEWQKLKGIGPYYAKKICTFRERLGGFYEIEQIAETYGLPDSTFLKIQPFLSLTQPVQQINLNLSSEKELAQHPYLKHGEAKVIVKYRKQHGDFSDLAQLEQILALKKETIRKISPYLSLN